MLLYEYSYFYILIMSDFFENYIGYLLARSSYKATHELYQELKQEGVSVLTWRILATIKDRSATVNELANRVLVSQSTLSKALDRIEQDDLIQRSQDTEQRRKTNISITDKGRTLIKRLIPIAVKYEQRAFENMSEDDKQQLKSLLQKLIDQQN